MTRVLAFVLRFIAFGLLWLVLTGGVISDVALTFAAIVSPVLASMWLWRPGALHIHFGALLLFIPYFLWQSVLGGWDVAKRALAYRMRVTPAIMEVTLQTRLSAHHVLVAWILSLLPGTASIRLTDGGLTFHVLDETAPHRERIESLERKVAAVLQPRGLAA
jgi:multicomponent Na+:H+ antiporter subunit E